MQHPRKSANDNKDAATQRHICQAPIHLKCNQLNYIDYKYLQGSRDPWLCRYSCCIIFPFGFLILFISQKSVRKYFQKKPTLSINTSYNLDLLFNQLNNSSPEQNVDPENVVNSRYFDTDEIQSLKLHDKDKSLFFFHTNTCSLNKTLIICSIYGNSQKKSIDIIPVSEARISKKT